MTVATTTALNAARLSGALTYLDTGTGNARIRVYDGTRAATVNTAPAGTLLAEITLAKPSGTVANGILTLAQLEDATITTTGTATWARVVNGNADTAFDCDVGTSNTDMVIASTTLYAGGALRILSLTLG